MSEYKFITQADIDSIWKDGTGNELKELAERFLKEREIFREIAVDCYCTDTNGVRKSWDKEANEQVDKEARHLLSEKEGDCRCDESIQTCRVNGVMRCKCGCHV